MKRIYKRTDRIAVKVDDIIVKLAPLTLDQKSEIQQQMSEGLAAKDLVKLTRGTVLAMKYSIKSVDGFEDADGQPYKVSLDEQGNLTDDCIDDLLNLEQKDKLTYICSALVRGIPNEFTDAEGKPLEGVSIASEGAKSPNE